MSPLWLSAMKTFGPYDVRGDAESRRRSDKQVRHDYNEINRRVTPDVLPRDLVEHWNRRQHDNASSHPSTSTQGISGEMRVPTVTDRGLAEKLNQQPDGTRLYWLVERRAGRYKIIAVRRRLR